MITRLTHDCLLKYELNVDINLPELALTRPVLITCALSGLDSNLRNYLYQKRKEVFVVNFIESDIFLVVLRLGVVVPTVTFCNYCQN